MKNKPPRFDSRRLQASGIEQQASASLNGDHNQNGPRSEAVLPHAADADSYMEFIFKRSKESKVSQLHKLFVEDAVIPRCTAFKKSTLD